MGKVPAEAAPEVQHALDRVRQRNRRHIRREGLAVSIAGEDALADLIGIVCARHRQPIVHTCHR
jgi:hypothetical protein